MLSGLKKIDKFEKEESFMATFIIPDIHGCIKTLKCLIEEHVRPVYSDTLVFLGDYIDRGPHSAATVSYLIELKQKGYSVVPIRGNHEQMLLNTLYNLKSAELWMRSGGSSTLASYPSWTNEEGQPLDEIIPEEHVAFLLSMPNYHKLTDSVYAVHGGIVFPITETDDSLQRMLWLRPWECEESIPLGNTVIHGHTPVPLRVVQLQVEQFGSLVNLDAGCVFAGREHGLGYLTCLNLESRELHYSANLDV